MIVSNDKLALYVQELFNWFAQERQQILEDTWNFGYDAFRGEYSSGNIARWKKLEGHEWRSQFFVRLTKQKIVAVVSQIEDIEFQGGKLPWDMSATPVPENKPGLFLDPKEAEFRCTGMKKQIDDYLTESQALNQFITSLLELALYGGSWLRSPILRAMTSTDVSLQSPIPGMVLTPEMVSQFGQWRVDFGKKQIPTVEHLNLWDVFWDLETANPQDGFGIIHRQMMSPGRFIQLAERQGYDKEAIFSIVEQYGKSLGDGPGVDPSEGPFRAKLQMRGRTIPVYEFYGRIPVKHLEGRGKIKTDGAAGNKELECSLIMAGDRNSAKVIRGPYGSDAMLGMRPMHFCCWEESPFDAGGIGVAENLRDTQAMLNSAVRCFIDNKALSSNLLVFGKSNALAPGQDRTWHSGKFFELANGVMDWREAMGFAQVPDVGQSLLDLIGLVERFADEDSNAPKLLQGETARHSPKTAFETGQLLTAANKALGKVIRNRERYHYEPALRSLYIWEMITGKNQALKGDYTCKATGYTSFINKEQKGRMLGTLLTMVMSNQILSQLVNPRVHLEEIYKASDLDPETFLKSEDQLQQEAQMMLEQMQGQAMGMPSVGGAPAPEGMPLEQQQPGLPGMMA